VKEEEASGRVEEVREEKVEVKNAYLDVKEEDRENQ
jgi:hypothetical protein